MSDFEQRLVDNAINARKGLEELLATTGTLSEIEKVSQDLILTAQSLLEQLDFVINPPEPTPIRPLPPISHGPIRYGRPR